MSLDVLFRSIGSQLRKADDALVSSIQISDGSEAQFISAASFLEQTYDSGDRGRLSRAQTPMSRGQTPMVRYTLDTQDELPGSFPSSPPRAEREPWHPPSRQSRPFLAKTVPKETIKDFICLSFSPTGKHILSPQDANAESLEPTFKSQCHLAYSRGRFCLIVCNCCLHVRSIQ